MYALCVPAMTFGINIYHPTNDVILELSHVRDSRSVPYVKLLAGVYFYVVLSHD
jgi:hypothetical protein